MKEAFEKILERLEERLKFYENRFGEMNGTDGDVEDWGSIKSYKDAIRIVNEVAEEYYNDGWIPCSSGKFPNADERVYVVLTHTYESEYIDYSVAIYIKFDNNEYHWCEAKNGYLEWDKYSNGMAGSSLYKVIAWKPITPYQPKGE